MLRFLRIYYEIPFPTFSDRITDNYNEILNRTAFLDTLTNKLTILVDPSIIIFIVVVVY